MVSFRDTEDGVKTSADGALRPEPKGLCANLCANGIGSGAHSNRAPLERALSTWVSMAAARSRSSRTATGSAWFLLVKEVELHPHPRGLPFKETELPTLDALQSIG